jgi:S-formylglutathione hydrolase FrmB
MHASENSLDQTTFVTEYLVPPQINFLFCSFYFPKKKIYKMKNKLLCLTILFSFILYLFSCQNSQNSAPTFVQTQGLLKEKQSIESKILGEAINYSIFLPPGYESTNRRYPVVYVLHGYTDDETAWVQFGEIDRQANQSILAGEIPPMILIMPDAKVTWYVNDVEGKKKYEDFFIQEFIPHIDGSLRTLAEKSYRGITGLSMGGYGSLLYAMKHPNLFAASAPLSAAIYTEETVEKYDQERWDKTEGLMYGKGLEGKNRISAHWKNNNPFYLLEKINLEKLKKVRFYFDCGDDDFLYEGNSKIHLAFRDLGIPHEFRMRDGAHNWTYWRTGIIPALQFIGESFHR